MGNMLAAYVKSVLVTGCMNVIKTISNSYMSQHYVSKFPRYAVWCADGILEGLN